MALRKFLKSKLHMARVTDANIRYEGSITIDEDLMDMAGIEPFEFVMVSNLNNGERFETYAIPGRRGGGDVCLNGATARKGLVGDRVIIFSLAYLAAGEVPGHRPKIIILSEDNRPVKKGRK
jgi:aspartate 1-decarboxylase